MATEPDDLERPSTLTLGELIAALQALQNIEKPGLNAMDDDDVVIRIDLGPDQEFTISAVSVDDRSIYDEDPIVVLTAGPHYTEPSY